MKILILSDVHNRIGRGFDDIVKRVPNCDRIICLGDLFDDFDDTPGIAAQTARWLKSLISDERITFLMGNHDQHYAFPKVRGYKCGGWEPGKQLVIDSILGPDDWDKMVLCHFVSGTDRTTWLLSHAGVHPAFLGSLQEDEVELARIGSLEIDALEDSRQGKRHVFMGAGADRMGDQTVGGITWLDWDSFVPIPGLNQIVGHTPGKVPRCKTGENSVNWCLDTHSKHYGIIEDGEFHWERV